MNLIFKKAAARVHTPHLQSDDDDDDDDKIESSLDLIHFDHPIKYPTLAV